MKKITDVVDLIEERWDLLHEASKMSGLRINIGKNKIRNPLKKTNTADINSVKEFTHCILKIRKA